MIYDEVVCMQVNKNSFCGGLKPSKINILFKIYRLERKSKEKLDEYVDFLKNSDEAKYFDFLEYKNKVEKRTPNLKEIYYEFLDGKREDLDFELFSP